VAALTTGGRAIARVAAGRDNTPTTGADLHGVTPRQPHYRRRYGCVTDKKGLKLSAFRPSKRASATAITARFREKQFTLRGKSLSLPA
jgi:hypothetical protein